MSLQREQQQLFIRMGIELLQLQAVEHAIRLCLQVVVPEEPIFSLDALRELEKKDQKRTLGNLLSLLRTRVKVAPEFDQLLGEFLESRNAFVHNLSGVQHWNPRTEEGVVQCLEFMKKLDSQSTTVLNVFTGLLRAWEIQTGNRTVLPGQESQFEQIEKDFVPLVRLLISEKDV